MAETYLAVREGQAGFEQRVCLKRILSAFDDDKEFIRLFMEEARLSAQLRHQNIAQVLDFGVVENSHFLLLELIEGMDLRGLLRARRREGLPGALVAHLAFELGSALEFAHGTDVVHRDISPSNVLLSIAGEVKLSDFGIAKAMSAPKLTASGVVKGKVPYMAPEYARLGKFDERSDLFSLGVTLYECIAGGRPFDGVTDLDTLERSSSGNYQPLRARAREVDPALAEAIERLLTPKPEDRFKDASEFLDAIADLDPPPTAARDLGNLVRQHMTTNFHIDENVALALEATALASPRGTMVMKDQARGPEVRASAPSDVTRTVLPDRDESETLVDEETTATRGAREVDTLPATRKRVRAPVIPTDDPAPNRGKLGLVFAAIAGALVMGGAVFFFLPAGTSNGPAREAVAAPASPSPTAPRAPSEPSVTSAVTPDATEGEADPAAPDDPEDQGAPQDQGPEDEESARAEPSRASARRRRRRRQPRPSPTEAPAEIAASDMTESGSSPMVESSEMRARATGTVRVRCHPWGNIWIDGRRLSSDSPHNATLSEGRHAIGCGRGALEETRRVNVVAGESQFARFNFD